MKERTPTTLSLPSEFARALTRYRYVRTELEDNTWKTAPDPLKREPRLHLGRVNWLERNLDVRIPDFVLGWYAAGLAGEGKWGVGPFKDVQYIVGLAEDLAGQMDAWVQEEGELAFSAGDYVPFDFLTGNYLMFAPGDDEDLKVYTLERDDLSSAPEAIDVVDSLEDWLGDSTPVEERPSLDDVEPIEVELYPEPMVRQERPKPETNGDVGRTVSHTKFGKGTVLKHIPGCKDKYEVEFEEHGTKRLIGDFLEFE